MGVEAERQVEFRRVGEFGLRGKSRMNLGEEKRASVNGET